MSILKRLFNIARAQIGGRESRDSFAEILREAQAQAASSQAHTRDSETGAGSAVDPEIAAYYANLELPYGSDLPAVKKAWKRLLQKYHPDLHSSDPEKRAIAHELTQGINRAYDSLSKHLQRDAGETN